DGRRRQAGAAPGGRAGRLVLRARPDEDDDQLREGRLRRARRDVAHEDPGAPQGRAPHRRRERGAVMAAVQKTTPQRGPKVADHRTPGEKTAAGLTQANVDARNATKKAGRQSSKTGSFILVRIRGTVHVTGK